MIHTTLFVHMEFSVTYCVPYKYGPYLYCTIDERSRDQGVFIPDYSKCGYSHKGH